MKIEKDAWTGEGMVTEKEKENLLLSTVSPDQLRWDVEVDVLVIGGGGCGLIASLAAAQQGAQVFLVEKEKGAGGNTSLSQAMVPAAGTRFQRAAGVED